MVDSLNYWCYPIRELKKAFAEFIMGHVFREGNHDADLQSKKALHTMEGTLHFEEFEGSRLISQGTISYYN